MKTIIPLFLFLGITAIPASAVNIFYPDNDSYVRLGNGDTNFDPSTLVVKNSNTSSTTRKAYTQFDISSIADPSSVVQAQLDVVVQSNSPGSGSYPYTYVVELWGLNDSVDETWTEETITWNNAPGNNTGNNNFDGDATLLGSFSLNATATDSLVGTTAGVDSASSAAFLTFIQNDTDGLVTLMLRRTDPSGSPNLAFYSKEEAGTASDPTLTLTIPEPSAFALLVGAFGFLGLRRRR